LAISSAARVRHPSPIPKGARGFGFVIREIILAGISVLVMVTLFPAFAPDLPNIDRFDDISA
tara:strand:- start:399 stop:584 length:186 start_codon:yes stop_codon:yes gene_type:complete